VSLCEYTITEQKEKLGCGFIFCLIRRPHPQQIRERFRHQIELRGLAVARKHRSPCGVEVEQQFAPRAVADGAARPADRGAGLWLSRRSVLADGHGERRQSQAFPGDFPQ
jgi:hypothetical protein